MSEGLEALLAQWKKLDLSNLQKDMDDDAAMIDTAKQTSDADLKTLRVAIKGFKASQLPPEIKPQYEELSRKYKEHIQQMRRHQQQAGQAFMSVYERLLSASDPVPVLTKLQSAQAKLKSAEDLQVENQRLKDTIANYRTEVTDMRHQDGTIKRLNEEIKRLNTDIEQRIADGVKDRERELIREFEEKSKSLEAQHVTLLSRVSEAERQAQLQEQAAEKAQHELLEVRAQFDDELIGHGRATELATSELETANLRIMELESQVESQSQRIEELLQSDAANISVVDETMLTASNQALGSELKLKEREIAQLVSKHHELQAQFANAKQSHDEQHQQFQMTITSLQEQLQEYQEKLDAQKDYSSIKDELRTFRSVEAGEDAQLDGAQSLEALLLRKNRTLESEATSLRNKVADLETQLTVTQAQMQDLRHTTKEQTSLIAQLESHISGVGGQQGSGGGVEQLLLSSGVSRPPNSSRQTATDSLSQSSSSQEAVQKGHNVATDADGLQSGTSSSAAGEMEKSQSDSTLSDGDSTISTPKPAPEDASLVSIVSAQRDRFRQRNLELEAALHHEKQQAARSRDDADRVRGDNIRLYEKIRYLESYSNSSGASKAAAASSDDVMSRYSTQYEDKINPFQEFSSQERRRKYDNLHIAERFLLTFMRTILNSSFLRRGFLGYVGFLQVFVLVVLYRFTHSTTMRHSLAEQCHALFASEHLAQPHAADAAHGVHFDSEALHDPP
eukprot:m.9123 g.9123  ORF g.9123 m.9123 type:complete len:734 (+) comp5427_c0_seq1:267-2468(+)